MTIAAERRGADDGSPQRVRGRSSWRESWGFSHPHCRRGGARRVCSSLARGVPSSPRKPARGSMCRFRYPSVEDASVSAVRVATCGLALQSCPTKEALAGLPLADLRSVELAALSQVEGEVAMAWAIERFPGLERDLRALLPTLRPATHLAGRSRDCAGELRGRRDIPDRSRAGTGEDPRPGGADRSGAAGDSATRRVGPPLPAQLLPRPRAHALFAEEGPTPADGLRDSRGRERRGSEPEPAATGSPRRERPGADRSTAA